MGRRLCFGLSFAAVMVLPLSAHGFAGAGFLHPLTGLDHLLAMLAVGAWSAQLGGRALWRVPLSFLVFMILGGLGGLLFHHLPLLDGAIAGSVILLGLAIALEKKAGLPLALLAVGLFGFCHGFAHGAELPSQSRVGLYLVGFMSTTLCLHVLGATGALLVLENRRGRLSLRGVGGAAAGLGIALLLRVA